MNSPDADDLICKELPFLNKRVGVCWSRWQLPHLNPPVHKSKTTCEQGGGWGYMTARKWLVMVWTGLISLCFCHTGWDKQMQTIINAKHFISSLLSVCSVCPHFMLEQKQYFLRADACIYVLCHTSCTWMADDGGYCRWIQHCALH